MKNKVKCFSVMRMVALVLLLCAALAGGVCGSIAKYTSSKSATSNPGVVAAWSFKVNDKDIATEGFAIAPFDIITDANVVANKLAPGTAGSFTIKLENTSDVAAAYEVKMTADEAGVPLMWCLTENGTYVDNIEALNFEGELAIGAEAKIVTVYWQWPFDGDDTALGIAAAAGNGAAPTVTVEVFAQQIEELSSGGTLISDDTSDPSLIVTVPETTSDFFVVVSGAATDESGISSVTVNGEEVAVDEDGSFGTSVELAHGEDNTITVIATDNAGNATTVTKIVASLHAYDQKVASSAFLKSAATCAAKAVYYYSCSCGAKGAETFEYGSVNASNHTGSAVNGGTEAVHSKYSCCGVTISSTHSYTSSVQTPATCAIKGTTKYACACGYSYTAQDIPVTEHIYDQEVVADEYLKSEATTTSPAIYYKSCKCGAKGAETFTYGNPVYTNFTIAADNRSQIGYTGATGENLVIPATFQGADGTWYKVTAIKTEAFMSCTGLKSVVIPDTVTSIDLRAFALCTSLTSINIPGSVTNLGSSIFHGCTGLKNVELGNGITSISNNMFYACSGLTSIVIPDTVTYIAEGGFQYCSGLTSVDLGSGMKSLGTYAFRSCTALTSVTLPNGVTSLGVEAFRGCLGLTSIIIPKTVTVINEAAFAQCEKLKNVYYTGTQAQWDAINIGSSNISLTSATITCNYAG